MGAIVFYDGVCGLCNRLCAFTLKRDARGHFRFAPLQGPLARATLGRHGRSPEALDTFYVLTTAGEGSEQLLSRSDAALYLLRHLPGLWSWMGRLGWVPRPLRDGLYGLVARHRYRLFGRYESCALPRPEWRERFLDADPADWPRPEVSPTMSGTHTHEA